MKTVNFVDEIMSAQGITKRDIEDALKNGG